MTTTVDLTKITTQFGLLDDEIRALLDGATPGPWKAKRAPHGPIDIFDHREMDIVTVYGGGVESEHKADNARLIAAAPSLAAEVLRLREALREIQQMLEGFRFVGMEMDPDYAAIASQRIAAAGGLFARETDQ